MTRPLPSSASPRLLTALEDPIDAGALLGALRRLRGGEDVPAADLSSVRADVRRVLSERDMPLDVPEIEDLLLRMRGHIAALITLLPHPRQDQRTPFALLQITGTAQLLASLEAPGQIVPRLRYLTRLDRCVGALGLCVAAYAGGDGPASPNPSVSP